jgi:hypothetical protein
MMGWPLYAFNCCVVAGVVLFIMYLAIKFAESL